MKLKVKKKKCVILLVSILAGLSLWFYQYAKAPKIKNVLVISIDTCRADYVSAYGFPLETTPNLDAVAQEGMLCEQVISPVPFTLPAHVSMLTGMIPLYHGVLDNGSFTVEKDNITLAEILKEQDFATGAFVSSFVLDSDFGMNQGFDTYNDDFKEGRKTMGIHERQGTETTELALNWIEKNQNEKQFLFVHYFDPHFTYEPPPPFDSKFANANIFPKANPMEASKYLSYAGEIAFVDHCIGRIIEKLKELGQYDSTLICITSDHGEMLGEHGESTHGYFIYRGNIEVPLVFKVPGREKGRTIKNAVGLIDIVPTICSALGIEIDHKIQGKDLLAYYSKDDPYPDRYLFCQSLEPTKYHANPLLGVVSDRYKYIQTTRSELYDLQKDTFEIKSLIQQEPKRARLMEGELLHIIENSKSERKTADGKGMDLETLRKLESLGYVGSMIDADFGIDPEKEDPKDLIDYHRLVNTIGYLIQIGEYETAERNCQTLIELKPDLYMGYFKMAKALMQREQYAEVIDYLDRVIELEPDLETAYVGLAEAHKKLGQFDRAVKYAHKALEIEKDSVGAYLHLSESYYEQGLFDEPEKYLTPEIAEHSGYAKVVRKLAETLYFKGQFKRCFNKNSELLELDPDSIDALNALAWLQAASTIDGIRDPRQAVKHALKACQISEFENPTALDTLAVAYAATGDFQKAIEISQKAIDRANAKGENALAGRIESRQLLYRKNKPYIETQL